MAPSFIPTILLPSMAPGIDAKQDVPGAIDLGVRQANNLLDQLFLACHSERVTDEQLRGRRRLVDQLLQQHGIDLNFSPKESLGPRFCIICDDGRRFRRLSLLYTLDA